MTIEAFRVGPGLLTFGAGPLNASSQAIKCAVEWEETVPSTETVDYLSGEQRTSTATPSYAAKLVATFQQDELSASGLIAYTWTNKGDDVPVVFEPNSALERRITGTITVVPINVGGDAGKENTSDVTMRFVGDPVLGDTP